MATTYERHRVGIDEYHRMVEASVFEANARLELIEGELVEPMTPINPRHASVTDLIMIEIGARLRSRAAIRCQGPITLGGDSEPQPDLTVSRLDPKDYVDHHPGSADILLVIEVADSSLEFDLRRKMPLYARAGIPEAWLVNLKTTEVVVHREPVDGAYTSIQTAKRGDSISIAAFPEEIFAVDDFLRSL